MKKLHDEGYSLAELALKFDCSKSLVRDLVELANLPKDLEEAYELGKMGRKKVLELARTGKSPSKPQEVISPQKPTKPEPASAPMMSQEERERKASGGADLVIEWFRSTGLPPCDWEMCWSQVNSGLYGRLLLLFTSEAPKLGEINPDEDPRAVIKRCQVKSKSPASMADVINDSVKELARWSQRIFQDREVMKKAFTRAESQLRREARELRLF
ncbi:MAG: hypothetical protein EPN47_16090 [Acidobacteria bacterium]|nr:MAG: hypothetical protein EPN47_16090 [Acidobacteriota bacterium]